MVSIVIQSFHKDIQKEKELYNNVILQLTKALSAEDEILYIAIFKKKFHAENGAYAYEYEFDPIENIPIFYHIVIYSCEDKRNIDIKGRELLYNNISNDDLYDFGYELIIINELMGLMGNEEKYVYSDNQKEMLYEKKEILYEKIETNDINHYWFMNTCEIYVSEINKDWKTPELLYSKILNGDFI